MSRKKKELDQKQFEALCSIWCTEEEICSLLETTDKTLNKWCKRTYGKDFSESYKRFSTGGKMSIRRKQKEIALGGNVSMLIWLGKQVLGQSDVATTSVGVMVEDDELSKSLRTLAKELKGDD